MPTFFVSYRRNDVPGQAGRLYDRLALRFGKRNVFMDLDSLSPGSDFSGTIMTTIERCDALLAVIGPGWLSAEQGGARRLDDPADFVRSEIAHALARGVPVVPILVDQTPMPAASALPEELQGLVRRHAMRLTDELWDPQVTRLLETLDQREPLPIGPTVARVAAAAVAAGFAAMLAGELIFASDRAAGSDPSATHVAVTDALLCALPAAALALVAWTGSHGSKSLAGAVKVACLAAIGAAAVACVIKVTSVPGHVAPWVVRGAVVAGSVALITSTPRIALFALGYGAAAGLICGLFLVTKDLNRHSWIFSNRAVTFAVIGVAAVAAQLLARPGRTP